MNRLRFAVFGTGFWSRYQLAGWGELEGAECVALYNRTREKAEALAEEFGVRAVYDDPEELLRKEKVDFIDVITNVETHAGFVRMAAEQKLPVICQKPMAATLEEAEGMVGACERAGVPFFVHENFRWQTPIRGLKETLDGGAIGRPFRAHVAFCSSFPVFDNQPFLKELDEFILTDVGSHVLDVARFLFGEARSLFCRTRRVHREIKGEDVATVMMEMRGGTTVICELSYATRWERERFPETFVLVEGEKGTAELGPDFWIRTTTDEGTFASRHPPPRYTWADPAYSVVHSSIVPCNANLLEALRTGGLPETHAKDNLETIRLVFASYESARSGRVMTFGDA